MHSRDELFSSKKESIENCAHPSVLGLTCVIKWWRQQYHVVHLKVYCVLNGEKQLNIND